MPLWSSTAPWASVVAAPELRRGGDGDQLVAALIHRGAYRRDQAAPGRANLGPECQDLRVVRDIAERLEIALVGLLELAGGLLERDLLDERHVGSPLRWWTGTVRGARVSRPGVQGRRLRPSSDPTRAPRAPPPARRPLRACSAGRRGRGRPGGRARDSRRATGSAPRWMRADRRRLRARGGCARTGW